MYAPPPAVVPVVPQRSGFNAPLAAICCLALVLFLIAATIVLALIPLYIPTKDATAGGNTNTYYFLMTPNQTLGDDGSLSDDATNTVSDAISEGLGMSAGALEADSATTVSTTSGGRRRRGFGISRVERQGGSSGQNCYHRGRFRRRFCGLCRIVVTVITIVVSFIYGGIRLYIQFVVYIFTVAINIPATQGSKATTRITTTAAGGGGGAGTTNAATTGAVTTSAAATTTTASTTGAMDG